MSACDAIPVPIDPDPGTFTIVARDVAAQATANTPAVTPVHVLGLPGDVPAIRRSLEGRSVLILEDAAQAHRTYVGGAPVGGLGDAAAFSFYSSKTSALSGIVGRSRRTTLVWRSLLACCVVTVRRSSTAMGSKEATPGLTSPRPPCLGSS